MIYNSLNEIPMTRFMDVYSGNLQSLIKSGEHSDSELKEVSERLIHEYISIIGGANIEAEINKRRSICNLMRNIRCMELCEGYMSLGEIGVVCEVLSNLGYKYSPDQKEKIIQRIQSLKANSQFNLDRAKPDTSNKESEPVNLDYFFDECVALETHFKMQIDLNAMSAKKYAFYIKRMHREIKASNDAVRKKMKK